jgi:uncharacterized membrane protein
MQHAIDLLVSTVVLRPYVFAFFACYLALALGRIGFLRTVLFTATAFSLAFISEWSSAVAGTGIPFGLYRYIETTRDRELWVGGVPFMDSLSFTFLSFVSWKVAAIVRGERSSIRMSILASILMTFLDIVIDPVALRGDRWFLGKLYYYPAGGIYFGVPIANFAGWFVVCFVIIRVYLVIERLFGGESHRPLSAFGRFGPLILYFGILGFNLIMTFWIGEIVLGLAGLSLTALVGWWLARQFASTAPPFNNKADGKETF